MRGSEPVAAPHLRSGDEDSEVNAGGVVPPEGHCVPGLSPAWQAWCSSACRLVTAPLPSSSHAVLPGCILCPDFPVL